MRPRLFFLTGVGQQLSASIDAIQSECRDLAEEVSKSEHEFATALYNSADLFAGILSTIQKYADPASIATRQEIFQPYALAKDILGEISKEADDHRLKMDVISLFEDQDTYLGSKSEIEAILHSVINNAVKFTSIGAVRVVVGPKGANDVIFTVEDTGPGVPPEKLSRIFEGFVQGDQSEIRVHGGLGLGLAIARKRARYFGGDVTYEPRAGCGSVFILEVPLARVRN